jgi:hypothetical protein
LRRAAESRKLRAEQPFAGGEPEGVKHFDHDMHVRYASPDWKIGEWAARHHGVVSRCELFEMGIGRGALEHRLRTGRLRLLYPGVYAVGHTALNGHGLWMAAVKACGPEALLSHQSGAALLALRQTASPIIHVTTPGRASPRGIRVHRVRRLHPDDVAVVDRVPVTSVARTLLDLADVLPASQLIRAIEQAERLQIFDLRAVNQLVTRSTGRRVRTLLTAIAAVEGEPARVNSHWERDLLDFCDDHDIQRPELNVIVEGYEVDALWREKKVIVELDSYAFHRSLRAFENDRLKYAKLQLARYIVLPLTRLDDAAAGMISAAIAAR